MEYTSKVLPLKNNCKIDLSHWQETVINILLGAKNQVQLNVSYHYLRAKEFSKIIPEILRLLIRRISSQLDNHFFSICQKFSKYGMQQ